ncbi:MAG: pyridoxamine 5'-phosphate oxidase [Pseudomonadota bacterium]|nr:pyridoxamine 5'-phosphate oxidase [Pseudomonadota bacterium]
MNSPLPDAAPGFDRPIAVLKHCHDRIRKQLATLEKLLAHVPVAGADEQAQQAAAAIIKYFEQGAPLHHADEEENLIPMLRAVAQDDDAATLQALAPVILEQHQHMDATWVLLRAELAHIAAGTGTALSEAIAQQFIQDYTAHMVREESTLAPMAMRLFSADQMAQLGAAMQARRNANPKPVTLGGNTGNAVADIRKDYGQASLDDADVLDDPIDQFTRWFDEALRAEVNEPNAMNVATVDAEGKPSSRIVLIKQFDQRGFTWFTNYDSRKGVELAGNPHAAILFFWSELERQVRIEGRVERVDAAESEAYFHTRPLKSRLAAVASAQSAPIGSRAALEQNYQAVEAQYGEQPPRPAHWGGYRLVPDYIEFWQGRRSRFHDRIVYTRQPDGTWARQRLQP